LLLRHTVPDYLPSGLPAVSNHAATLETALQPEEAVDWRRRLAAVLRYRWWVLALTVLGAAGGAVSAHMLPTSYQAQATIWIQSSDTRGGASRGPIGSDQLFSAYAWLDLLRSYVVLDEVARELRFYVGAPYRYRAAFSSFTVGSDYRPGRYRMRVNRDSHFRLEVDDSILQEGTVGDSIGQSLGFRWAPTGDVLPAGSDIAFTVRPLRDAAKSLGSALTVTMKENGNFLSISLTGRSPEGVARTVNAVANRYVAVATELKRVKLTEVARLLNEQFLAAGRDLQQAESAYEKVRVRSITVTPELTSSTSAAGVGGAAAGGSAGAQALGDFFSLKLEQDRLRRDREAIERVLASGSVDGLALIGAVQRSADLTQALRELTTKRAELRALRYGYTADHPSVRRVTGEIRDLERTTIPELARAFVTDLAAREQMLAPQIAGGSRDLQTIPQRAIEEARLRRDMDMAATLYLSVQQRYNEARLAEASSVADVRVLDAAVAPQEALRNKASRHIILGFAAGLGLGLLGAVLADRFDPRMRYPDQVTRQMGLPILGVLPHVTNRGADPGDDQVTHVIETMRGVRLSVQHAHGAAGPIVLTVTSPGVGDGKSFVATNLALAFAQAGQRTLLIDGDTRRGALHRILQASRQPGLTDLLEGAVPLEAVIQAARYPRLHFIGGGRRSRESPELLGSPAMVDLLVRLRAAYEVILVDTPPLGAGVDSYTLGALTGNMMLVLRTGATNLELARTKLGMLTQFPIRVLGVVLNDVRPGQMYGYFYGYIPGYGATDESGASVTRRRIQSVV
jgi:capsular exopolysaccharide synthesis family protein